MGAYEVKTHVSELLELVEYGETVTVTRRGRVVARVCPVRELEQPPLTEIFEEIADIRATVLKDGPESRKLREEGGRF